MSRTLASFANGFKVLPISFSADSLTVHILYIKRHDSTDNLIAENSLFVLNVPVDASLQHFQRLFRRCGVVIDVAFKQALEQSDESSWSPLKSGMNCHITFEDSESVDKVMCMKSRKRVWSDVIPEDEIVEETPCTARLYGVQKWIAMYQQNRPSLESLEARVNKYMASFDQAEKEEREAAALQKNLPDEDGFVLVTKSRGRRNTTKDGKGATVTAARPEELEKLKPKKLELKNFYRFQLRESKREEVSQLRQQFEKDKLKIEALKADRKFKPY